MDEMKAIAVSEYGSIDQLVAIKVPKPGNPEGHDILVRYAANSHFSQGRLRLLTFDQSQSNFSKSF